MGLRTVLAVSYAGLHEALAGAGFQTIAWPKTEADWPSVVARALEIDAVVTIGIYPLSEAFMAAATNLRLIICLGAGYDCYNPKALAARGIKLANSSGVNADDVAELAFGLLIAA